MGTTTSVTMNPAINTSSPNAFQSASSTSYPGNFKNDKAVGPLNNVPPFPKFKPQFTNDHFTKSLESMIRSCDEVCNSQGYISSTIVEEWLSNLQKKFEDSVSKV